ncbi:homoprotocatechuate degradation operon regulator HpaR [Eleftheria terrae]|uniref:homoprotocatechuate degradation operon regulator HpaR n=1 Tax=Eleftheria terrae TaxID=1597781 RepID=UPI00263B20EA|nr:homoprotocatechuate degradation operon regulator HpaR [Eleftheria terrae]WKB52457.1 homoprotocatechuate degradation operon regulator HpaR [Eleftheria terrae]
MPAVIQHRNLPHALLRAREAVMRYFRPNLKLAGVTEQQWRVIRTLSQHGEMEIGRIAEACSIPGPSLTGVLERMERDDWIKRFRISTDQRKVVVELTPKSRRLVDKMASRVDARYQEIESQLGPQVLGRLLELLDRVAALPDPGQIEPVKLPISRRQRTPVPRKAPLARPRVMASPSRPR